MAPLNAAVALAEVHDVAVRVGEDLHFDVTRRDERAFEEHFRVAERRERFRARRTQRACEIAVRENESHAAAATARRRLDHEGHADRARGFDKCGIALVGRVVAR